MKNSIILCFLLLSFIVDSYSDGTFFEEIKAKLDLIEDELVLVTYQNLAACIKCYIEPIDLIEFIELNKGELKIKYIALVRCDREIELTTFQRETGWKYKMMVDDGSIRKKLNDSTTSIISLYDHSGKILLNIYSGNSSLNKKKIKNFLDNY